MPYAMRDPRTKRHTGKFAADATYKCPDGSTLRYHKAFATHTQAVAAEQYFKATGKPMPTGGDACGMSFDAAASQFMDNNPEWGSRSQRSRMDVTRRYFAGSDVATIRYKQLEDFVAWLRRKKLTDRTIKFYLDTVFKVLKYAHKREVIASLPAKPELAIQDVRYPEVSWEAERSIVAWVAANRPPSRAFLLCILASTGMRTKELLALRKEQIGDNGISLKSEQTKTHRDRWVPLLPHLAKKLRFTIEHEGLPERFHLYRDFKAGVESVGEDPLLNLHSLRHSTNTRLLDQGFQEVRVKRYLGHSVPGMTGRYDHPERQFLLEMAQKVQHDVGDLLQSADIVPLRSLNKSA